MLQLSLKSTNVQMSLFSFANFCTKTQQIMASLTEKVIKKCRTCGDDSSVFYNYHGLSCKSCKKFFVRNCEKLMSLKCRNERKCRIDKEFRRYCKLCRLEKCFQIGMKKEMVRPRKNESKSPESKLEKSNFVEFSSDIQLQDYERQCIAELDKAANSLFLCKNYQIIGAPHSLLEAINIGEITCRKYVEFCKKLSPFKNLKQEDQLTLLKFAFPDISCVYVAYIYQPESGGYPVIANEAGDRAYFISFLKILTRKEKRMNDVGTLFAKFVLAMHPQLEMDPILRNLILAQLLFKPRPNITCPELIHYYYLFYIYLCKRYLEHKYKCKQIAELRHNSLMHVLARVDDASNHLRKIHQSLVETSQIASVVAEIYNLV